jgi:hypothetical protein
MSNDFKGDPREFAVVIPVPAVLQKDQIHVGEGSAGSPRRLFGAAPGRVLRRGSVQPEALLEGHGRGVPGGRLARGRGLARRGQEPRRHH